MDGANLPDPDIFYPEPRTSFAENATALLKKNEKSLKKF